MSYTNKLLPAPVREAVEAAVTALVDHPALPLYVNARNCVSKIALVCYPTVETAIVEILYSDEAAADDRVVRFLNRRGQLEILCNHAARWLAEAVQEKYLAIDDGEGNE